MKRAGNVLTEQTGTSVEPRAWELQRPLQKISEKKKEKKKDSVGETRAGVYTEGADRLLCPSPFALTL